MLVFAFVVVPFTIKLLITISKAYSMHASRADGIPDALILLRVDSFNFSIFTLSKREHLPAVTFSALSTVPGLLYTDGLYENEISGGG